MAGYKNLGHKQEFNAQRKGALTKAHLNVVNGGDYEGGMSSLMMKHAGNKKAQEHLKKMHETYRQTELENSGHE